MLLTLISSENSGINSGIKNNLFISIYRYKLSDNYFSLSFVGINLQRHNLSFYLFIFFEN